MPLRIFHINQLNALKEQHAELALQWKIIAALAETICSMDTADVLLTGSLANGTADIYSDIDLEVFYDFPDQLLDLKQEVERCLTSAGKRIAVFAATHLQLPDLLIYFWNIQACLVKIDVHYIIRNDQTTLEHGLKLVCCPSALHATKKMSATTIEIDFFTDLHNKFVGWMWYTHTKILRGEYWEAMDSIDLMRSKALMPMFQFVRGFPFEGYRHAEQRLTESDLKQLETTICHHLSPQDLERTLMTLINVFEQQLPSAILVLGKDFRTADLVQMKEFILNSIKSNYISQSE